MLVSYLRSTLKNSNSNVSSKIAYFDSNGTCIIGMELKVLMPLIIFDACINADSRLKTVALRSFVGSCCTLASSIANLTVLMVLRGEASWICLMCCNADTIFSVLMLHWVTSKDSATNSSRDPNSHNDGTNNNKSQTYRSKIARFARPGKEEEQAEWEWQLGVTTTKIEVGNKDGHDTDMEDGDHKGGINVRVGHSVVVETDLGSSAHTPPSPRSTATQKTEYEEGAHIGNGLGRVSGHVSTEDLVKKDVKFLV
ncbi:hypothetical protein M7I_3885 [Glarea lozoyensis 74030]|uniref:Uncharacterized protein n=1 Tax=Glarea lozoyensis (strain ATCC 74030 / MF5533) TaxID=1104152 RepID=H0EMP6_GLAL7|nr:hypothetical protein M7I_3885 [Glarea lozoyensis 74030]